MWTFAATRKLSLSVAGRIDSLDLHHSGTIAPGFQPSDISDWNRTTTTFSANAGVVYKLTDLDTARATYARGFQLPSLVELGAAQLPYGSPPSGLSVGGNPDLQPTVVSNYQLSYDRNIPQLNAQAGAKIFYQQNKLVQGQWNFAHPEYAATATANAETVFENASNSDMTGFELSASGKLKAGFHWSADTTYTNIWDRALDGYSLIGKQVDYAKSTPKYRGNLALGWADNHWSADGFIHYITQYATYDGIGLVSSPAYATLGGRVAYTFANGFTAALSGQNLTTDRQIQAGPQDLRAPRIVRLAVSKSW